jgi:hypothetical protein
MLDCQPEVAGSRGTAEMSPRDERLATLYLAWGAELGEWLGVKAPDVAAWVTGDRRPPALVLLTRALDLWAQVRDDHDRAAKAERRAAEPANVGGNLNTAQEGHSCSLGGGQPTGGVGVGQRREASQREGLPPERAVWKRSV